MHHIIMLKASSDNIPEKGHEAYTRVRRGKQEFIKQKGTKKEEKREKKEPREKEPKEKEERKNEIGHVVLIPETKKEVKITAVGKDGVTAKDDKGNRYMLLHENLKNEEGQFSKDAWDEKEEKGEEKSEEREGKGISYNKLVNSIRKLYKNSVSVRGAGKDYPGASHKKIQVKGERANRIGSHLEGLGFEKYKDPYKAEHVTTYRMGRTKVDITQKDKNTNVSIWEPKKEKPSKVYYD